MAVIQEAFYVPQDIATGLATGLYRRIGGVIRYAEGPNKGQLVKFLDPLGVSKAQENEAFLEKATRIVKENKNTVLIGSAVVVALVGGATLYYRIKTHEPSVVKDFKKALTEYIEAIRNGNMTIDTIDSLMSSLEAMRQHKNFEKISIKLTAEELDTLIVRISEYTDKLAKDNEYTWEKEQTECNDNSILKLQKYLEIQKEIFRSAA